MKEKQVKTPLEDKDVVALRLLIQRNYDIYCKNNEQFWKPLHAVDTQLTPGCISLELYKSTRFHPESDKCFDEGERTVVIRIRDKKIAQNAADALNFYFRGADIKNVVEDRWIGDQQYWQIRSNMDKPQWDRMCVFLKIHSFSHELSDVKHDDTSLSQQEQAIQTCRDVVEMYSGNTEQPWKSIDGVPAFCSLLGMHGLLRPIGKHTANIQRKQEELNMQHPRGTPHLMENVPISVRLNRKGEVNSQYIIGHSLHDQAMARTMEGGSIAAFCASLVGGGAIKKDAPLATNVLEATGVLLGVWALANGEQLPRYVAAGGATIAAAAYVYQRGKEEDDFRRLKRGKRMLIQMARDEKIPVSEVDQRLQALFDRVTTPKGERQFEEVQESVCSELEVNPRAIHNIADSRPRIIEDLLEISLRNYFYGADFYALMDRRR